MYPKQRVDHEYCKQNCAKLMVFFVFLNKTNVIIVILPFHENLKEKYLFGA